MLGWIGGAMVVAAVYLLLFGGPGDSEVASTAPPPVLEVLEPSTGDSLAHPLQIRFRVDAPFTRQPGGWGSGGYHLHASVDGREIMPRPSDIQRLGASTYRWTFPPIPAESASIRLFWSDRAHQPISRGGDPIQIQLIR